MSNFDQKTLYFDYHATTPVDPRTLEVMLPYFTQHFGNASSKQHVFGWESDRAVEKARKQIADHIGATPQEIIFTAGGTESDNLVIHGVWEAFRDQGCHFITTAVEHKAILEPLKHLKKLGAEVDILPVDNLGRVSAEQVEKAIRPTTRLVSVIYGNNEIGTLNNISEIARVCKNNDVLFHSDAVQALGRTEINVESLGLDLMSISGHKIYAPKGVGALYIKRRTPRIRLEPMFRGGGQEKGIRSGTLNIPGIVGLGHACELLTQEIGTEKARLKYLQNKMILAFKNEPGLKINGCQSQRMCNNISVTVEGIKANKLITALPRLAISTGSACSTQSVEPSYVLLAIGLSEEEAVSTVRFGLGRFTTENEVESGIVQFLEAVRTLRKMEYDSNITERSKPNPTPA